MQTIERIKNEIDEEIAFKIDLVNKATDIYNYVIDIIEAKAKKETLIHKDSVLIMADLKLYSWEHFDSPVTDVNKVAFKGLQEALESDFRRFYLKANTEFIKNQKIV